jgi:hypothetical protein
LKRQESS